MTLYPPNRLKRLLANREPALGFWLSSNSLAVTEIAAGAGFDWVLLDMEHTATNLEMAVNHVLAAHHAGGDTEFVVRIPSIDPTMVKLLMDAGVRSFMFPWVQTVEDAKLAVASTRYAPKGIRGVSGITRATRFMKDRDYYETHEQEICIIAQIETPEAIDNIPAYGAIEGIDGFLIGPNDLSASMGLFGQLTHPQVRAEIERGLAAMKATSAAPGILSFDNDRSKELLEQGFSLIAVGGDTTMLVRGLAELRDAFR
jgi:4-hydroxy-2-oxoheptanedioate aldolase